MSTPNKVIYNTNCYAYLFAGYCTEYSLGGNIIQQSFRANCTQFTENPCPHENGYQSTDAYKCKSKMLRQIFTHL